MKKRARPAVAARGAVAVSTTDVGVSTPCCSLPGLGPGHRSQTPELGRAFGLPTGGFRRLCGT